MTNSSGVNQRRGPCGDMRADLVQHEELEQTGAGEVGEASSRLPRDGAIAMPDKTLDIHLGRD